MKRTMRKLVVMIAMLALCLIAGSAGAEATGTGTESDPYVVTTWADLKTKMAEGGYIRLDADVSDPDKTSSSYLNVPSGVTVTLNLNGHTIDRALTAATSNGYVISVTGTLTVNDSSNPSTGTITGGWNSGGYGGGVNIGSGGTFTLNNGTISGNKVEKTSGEAKGGAVYVGNNAVFNMYGGSITNNSVITSGTGTSSQAKGGAVWVNSYNNNYGTFNMYGGSITGNSVSGSSSSTGGGVYLDGRSSPKGKLNVSGNVTITGNTANSATNNVDVPSGAKITIAAALDAATRIGITAPAGQTVTSGLNGRGSLDNFTSDNASSGIVLVLSDNEVKVETTGEVVAAKAATCTESGISQDCWLKDGHYYSDQACTQEIYPVIPALGHNMSHHKAVAATETTSGNIEHWTCSRCGKYFLDEQGNEETTLAAVTINPTVSYIDADGSERSVQATILTGAETILSDGWYVAFGTVSFGHKFYLDNNDNIHVKIILADGATMSFGTSTSPLNEPCITWASSDNVLSIYGQANGTGTLAMYSEEYALNIPTVNIYGGHVTAQGGTNKDGINASNGITIKGGNVHATGGDKGITTGSNSTITLGWRSAADRIYASSYEYGNGGSVQIVTDQYLYNGTEVLGGTVTDLTKVDDKTLQPAVKITLPVGVTASGTNVFNQTDGTYALPGATVTLSHDDASTGYTFGGYSSDDVTISEGTFTIPAKDVAVSAAWRKLLTNTDITIAAIPTQEYTGSTLTPAITVKDGETTLEAGTHYTIGDWSGELINADTYMTTLTGIGDYDGSVTADFTIGKKEVGLTWSDTALTFNGSAQAPTVTATETVNGDEIGVTVTVEGEHTNAGDDYTAMASALIGDKAGNYKLPATGLTQTFSISKAAEQTIANVTQNLTYTETSVSASIADQMPENAGTLTYVAGTATKTGSVDVSAFDVDTSGVITATISGGAINDTITLPVTIRSTNYEDSTVNVVITLVDKTDAGASITGTGVSSGTLNKIYGDAAFTLTGTVTDAGEKNGGWTWESSNTDVAEVDNTGKVTIKAASSTPVTITATYSSDTTIGTATLALTVNKATPAISAAPTASAITYGQTLNDSTLTGGEASVAGTFAWTTGSTAPTVAQSGSTFEVTFTPTDSANYESVACSVAVTVYKAANPATVTGTASVTKGDNTVDLSTNVARNGATGDVSYEISGADNGCTINGSVLTSGTNTGSVTVNVTVAADDNYEALAVTPITVTITDKAVQAITAEDVAVVYGDTDKSVSATTSGDGALSYTVKSGDAVTVDENSGTLTIVKAGTSVITVTAAETATYAQATKDVTVTINPKTIGIPTANTDLKWTGEEQTGVAEGDGYTVADGKKTDVGDYTATATLTSTTNYKWSDNTTEPKTIAWTISKADLVVTAPKPVETLVYTGSEITLVMPGSVENDYGTLWYAVRNDENNPQPSEYTTFIPAKTDAGTYYVWYKVTGDQSHNDISPASIKVTIATNEEAEPEQNKEIQTDSEDDKPGPAEDEKPAEDKKPTNDEKPAKDEKPAEDAQPETDDGVTSFVKRCYKQILGRDADEGGLAGWTEALRNKTATAAQIIDGFVRSPEFVLRQLGNEAAVDILYRTMLDREADPEGKAGWTDALNQGYTLQNIIDGFCGSVEFNGLCKKFGIEAGSVGEAAPGAAANTPRGKIEAFVKRCYQLMLGRDADEGGLTGWSDALESGAGQACQIINGFVRSPEYVNRNLDNGTSVDILYKTMLNRDADPEGRAGWVDALGQGYTLQHIINGFCGSAEFTAICNDYGISAGTLTVASALVKREAITPEGEEAAPVIVGEYRSEFINEEKIRTFVEHCYRAVFGREGDTEGVENYTAAILDGKKTPKKVAYEFVFSAEFQEKLPGNEEFIRILYRLYFDREPGTVELSGWVQMLEGGATLDEIVNGFASSAEFKAIVNNMKN